MVGSKAQFARNISVTLRFMVYIIDLDDISTVEGNGAARELPQI